MNTIRQYRSDWFRGSNKIISTKTKKEVKSYFNACHKRATEDQTVPDANLFLTYTIDKQEKPKPSKKRSDVFRVEQTDKKFVWY